MDWFLVLVLVLLGGIAGVMLVARLGAATRAPPAAEAGTARAPAPEGAARRVRRRMGDRAVDEIPAAPINVGAVVMPGSDDDDDADNADAGPLAAKTIGKKKQARLDAKAAAREAREAAEAQRLDRKERERLQDEMAKKTRLEEAEKAKADAALAKAHAEEEQRRAEAEYQAHKAAFSIDDVGTSGEGAAAEPPTLAADIVAFVKAKKVVLVEEVATQFRLQAFDALARLRDLQETGQLTGILDDHGKFIYITEKEMSAVVQFVRQRGRVSIAELSENSRRLISFESEIPT